jgi:hypothetical protein
MRMAGLIPASPGLGESNLIGGIHPVSHGIRASAPRLFFATA